MEQSATGSPTTATRLWARVMAVFSSFQFERNPKSSSLAGFNAEPRQVLRVRTVLRKIARNCLPGKIKIKIFYTHLLYYGLFITTELVFQSR